MLTNRTALAAQQGEENEECRHRGVKADTERDCEDKWSYLAGVLVGQCPQSEEHGRADHENSKEEDKDGVKALRAAVLVPVEDIHPVRECGHGTVRSGHDCAKHAGRNLAHRRRRFVPSRMRLPRCLLVVAMRPLSTSVVLLASLVRLASLVSLLVVVVLLILGLGLFGAAVRPASKVRLVRLRWTLVRIRHVFLSARFVYTNNRIE